MFFIVLVRLLSDVCGANWNVFFERERVFLLSVDSRMHCMNFCFDCEVLCYDDFFYPRQILEFLCLFCQQLSLFFCLLFLLKSLFACKVLVKCCLANRILRIVLWIVRIQVCFCQLFAIMEFLRECLFRRF